MAEKHFDKDKSILMELVRFVVVGVYVTLIDFAIEGWVTSLLSTKLNVLGHIAAFFAMFAISVVGFLLSTPASWSLTSVWGFRNVSEEAQKKTKSLKGVLLFTFWSFLALLLGAVIQFFGYMICLEWSSLNINILGGFNFQVMFVDGRWDIFWAWAIVLVIRTMVTMTFNYLTRKFILYKAPKAE